MSRGIAVAGNLIVDRHLELDAYPAESRLASITSVDSSPGGLAHNCAVDHHRRARSTPVDSQEDGADVIDAAFAPDHERPDLAIESRQRLSRLERALHALPEEQREAFLLHEESGLDVAQIAQITEVGVETAKSRLRYAIGKLRRSLAESDERVAQAG